VTDAKRPRRHVRPLHHARAAYPPIGDYAFLSDCHSVALVSMGGSVDWCCMPRIDSGSCFGRLLDWEGGGFCSIAPETGAHDCHREYLPGTMVVATTFAADTGAARVVDGFTMRSGGRDEPMHELFRIVEGVRGEVDLEIRVVPRFDYGSLKPWLRHGGKHTWAAIGGNDGLVICCDQELEMEDGHDLACHVRVHAGQRLRLVLRYSAPEAIDQGSIARVGPEEIDQRVEATIVWWRNWVELGSFEGPDREQVMRSALVLKALSNAPTGAIAAAATTSLPERLGGERNWDYRFSWFRDSAFSVRSLALIGFDREADGFRRFAQRSAAGSAHDLQIMYGIGGERRLTEMLLPHLDGYRGSRPVRVGNAAAEQLQLDAYGELLQLTWIWHRRGASPDDDYWRFLTDLVDVACERWREADRGIWEIRGEPRHFVHSKVMCWVAVDRGLAIAEECLRRAPIQRWRRVAREIRESIETGGVDASRNCFVQAYGATATDAALLLLPSAGFCAYDDPRMVSTVREVMRELLADGLLLRYRAEAAADDGLSKEREGRFLACTFWLAECLASQGRVDEARVFFDRAAATRNDLGLFAEEFDPPTSLLLGNFPQGLTHLSHIAAAVAMSEAPHK
jgi:GH15 family glucan-1,4-alpha-glucosidase